MKLTHKVAAVHPVNSSHRNGASLIVSRYKLGYVLDLKDQSTPQGHFMISKNCFKLHMQDIVHQGEKQVTRSQVNSSHSWSLNTMQSE